MVGRIPRNFIDELINRIELVDLIDSYVSLRKTGRNYKACCPFHTEKTPSFTVNPDKQFYYCFGCGAHGSAIGFMMDYAHLNFIEAVHELASRAGLEVVYEQGYAPQKIAAFDDLYEIMDQAAQYYRQQLRQSPAAIDYLKKRGLTGVIARDFGLGYAPPGWDNLLKALGTDSDRRNRLLKTGLVKQNESGRRYDCFRDRIMFPILDQRKRVIAFGGRKLLSSEHEPKYLNSPETPLFQKNQTLYGWHLACQTRSLKNLIVVEGYMDVVALAQYGISNVVATLGTATTDKHLNRLFRRVAKIIFCFDGDSAGKKAAWRALETALPLLQRGREIHFVFLPQGSDPDSFVRQKGTNGFNAYLAEAKPLSDFLFEYLEQEINLNSPEGKSSLVEKAIPVLKRLSPGTYRELMLKKLSELSGANLNELKNKPISKGNTFKRLGVPNSIGDLSLEYQAIIYLLHKPTLSEKMDVSSRQKLSQLNQQDIKLLLKIIELTRVNPQLSLGRICEQMRGTEYEHIIEQLSGLPIETHSEKRLIDIEAPFFDAINRLYKNYVDQRNAFLTQKITHLTAAEKQELQSLYRDQNSY